MRFFKLDYMYELLMLINLNRRVVFTEAKKLDHPFTICSWYMFRASILIFVHSISERCILLNTYLSAVSAEIQT